jgi:hypothetical protein
MRQNSLLVNYSAKVSLCGLSNNKSCFVEIDSLSLFHRTLFNCISFNCITELDISTN